MIRLTGLTCIMAAAAAALSSSAACARITFDFDYTYDVNGFFSTSTANGQAARAALNFAADTYSDRFLDSLGAITPTGQNSWTPKTTNPSDGTTLSISGNPTIAANTLKVYAGGYAIGGTTLGIGGAGGYGASGFQDFFDALKGRGQAGTLATPPTDVSPWGGSIRFTTTATWNYDIANGPSNTAQSDFLSVALHELGHLLGIGGLGSWQTYISNSTFTGPKASALYGGAVPLGDAGHLGNVDSTVTGSDVQKTAMSPSIIQGTRKRLTLLDWAAFDDIGWDLARPGDADASGGVDFNDLLTLAKNYGKTSGVTWSEGDFNYTGSVNFDDLLALAKSYGQSGALPASAEISSAFAADWALAQSLVPEPAALTVVGGAISFLAARRRRA